MKSSIRKKKRVIVIDTDPDGKFLHACKMCAVTVDATFHPMNPTHMMNLSNQPHCSAFVFAPGVDERYPQVVALMSALDPREDGAKKAGVWAKKDAAIEKFQAMYGPGSFNDVWQAAIDAKVIFSAGGKLIFGANVLGASLVEAKENVDGGPLKDLFSDIKAAVDRLVQGLAGEVRQVIAAAVEQGVLEVKAGWYKFKERTIGRGEDKVVGILVKDKMLFQEIKAEMIK